MCESTDCTNTSFDQEFKSAPQVAGAFPSAEHKMQHWAGWVFPGGTGRIDMSVKFLSSVGRAGVTAQSEDAPAALLTAAWHWIQQDQATWAPPELQAGIFKTSFERLWDADPGPLSPTGHACYTLGMVCMHVVSRWCFMQAVRARFCVKLKPKG